MFWTRKCLQYLKNCTQWNPKFENIHTTLIYVEKNTRRKYNKIVHGSHLWMVRQCIISIRFYTFQKICNEMYFSGCSSSPHPFQGYNMTLPSASAGPADCGPRPTECLQLAGYSDGSGTSASPSWLIFYTGQLCLFPNQFKLYLML